MQEAVGGREAMRRVKDLRRLASNRLGIRAEMTVRTAHFFDKKPSITRLDAGQFDETQEAGIN
jgi:hypothetical protein